MANITFDPIPNGISDTLGDEINDRFVVLKDAINATPTGRGAWNSATVYVVGDLVQSAGSTWKALANNTNVTPVEGASWTVWAAKGADGASGVDASLTVKGIVKLSTAPVSSTIPIAVGDNDTRMTNARTPTAHAASHASGGSDALSISSTQISDSTASGRTLLAGANASAQRTSLGLGSSATLNVPASGNAASGEVVKGDDGRLSDSRAPTTHTHTASQISDSTAAGRALLMATDVAAQKTALSLNNVDNTSDANKPISTVTQTALNGKASSTHTHAISDTTGLQAALDNKAATSAISPAFSTLTDGSTITWNVTDKRTDNAKVTLGGNRTLAFSGLTDGATGVLIVKQDATGSRTLTLPSGSKVIAAGGGAVTLSTTANAIDILSFVYDGTNTFWTLGKDYS